ncbi:hypothetical protein [Microcoleus sp. OTE_8_concoct_300]|uniref:hypothetical protein n=1 Tax=Microcoleus sp. OTE_8_concoct_300 TaxID=2964710 RepID=UPI00403F7B3F
MTNIGLGQTIDGSLSSTDAKNPKRLGSFSDDYTLTGVSNWQQVQINLDSTDLDSYLQLVNASTGEVITYNDGLIKNGNNSQLKFTVIPGVNYTIRATSFFDNEIGNYNFKTSSLGIASSLVVTKNGQEAGTVDPLGRFVKIGNFVEAESSSTFFDIAFSNDNKLLGIKKDPLPSQLYKINPETGSSSVIGNFASGVEMIALEPSPNNILYGASRSKETSNSFTSSLLYTINPQTGTASSIADFPWDEGSVGDIAFDPGNNRFLFAKDGSLLSVSLTGQSTKIGDIGFDGVVGLSFEGSTLVGFTSDNKRIVIDSATGEGTFDRDITGLSDGYTIIGAGSIPSATRTTTPTVETPKPTTVTGQVEANFVDSITDQKLKLGIAGTKSDVAGAAILISAIIDSFVDKNTLYSTTKALDSLSEGSDKLPYGYFPDNLGMKSRKVNLKLVPESSTQAKQTWIVIHGLNVSADDNPNYAGDFSDLGKAVAQTNPGDRVLLLDWKEAAAGGKLNKTESDIDALLRLSNYTAAKWIRPVAEWVVKNLKEEFGVDAEYASKNLNLIGHSLGSLLSNEIARVWQEEQTATKKGIDPNGKGIGVNTIFALDPPSQANISTLSQGKPGFGYDVDGRTPEADFISPDSGSQQIYLPNFKEVSNFSRAFVGKNSLSGNQIFAAQADESFQMSFNDQIQTPVIGDQPRLDAKEHQWVIEAFKNLIIQKNELGDIEKLVNQNPILTDLKGKGKAYDDRHAGILAFNTPQFNLPQTEPKNDEELPKPLFLTVKNKDGGNDDDIVYGSNRNDTLIGGNSLYSGVGKDNFYGQAGDDTIYGGKDNDTLFGDQGDDFLSGDNGNDYLNGGLDNDTLIGVNQNEDRLRGFGQIDTLIGGGGADLFILGTTKTNTLYDDGIPLTNGIRDYALIVDFGNIGGQDTIQLRGSKSQYILGNSPNGLPAGRGIYLDNNRNQQFDPTDELIAIVQQGGVGPTLGTPVNLNLDASYFKYV